MPVMACPSKRTCPASGLRKPTMVLKVVDLPAPLGPMMATTSRGATCISTPWRILILPYPEWRSRTSSMRWLPPEIGFNDSLIPLDLVGEALGDELPMVEHEDLLAVVHYHLHVVLHD